LFTSSFVLTLIFWGAWWTLFNYLFYFFFFLKYFFYSLNLNFCLIY
jgi:hypothetical protein